jgi:hypothetical protein
VPRAQNRPTDFVAQHAKPKHADAGPRTPVIVALAVLIAITATAIGLRSGSHPAQVEAAAVVSASATPFGYSLGADTTGDRPAVPTGAAATTSGIAEATPVPTTLLASTLAANGIPTIALQAYESAAAQYDKADPACRLPWSLLAAIGRVESDHGRFAGAVLRVDGTSTPPIIGPALNGAGTALVVATPTGVTLDGDRQYDHAIGPMQIIPSTWLRYTLAATGHATANPFNIFDAAATAARYLCVAGGDLGISAGQLRAVFAYNHSDTYVSTVLTLENAYDSRFTVVSAGQVGTSAPKVNTPIPAYPSLAAANVPPANPGPPSAITPPPTGTPTPSATGTASPSESVSPTHSQTSGATTSSTPSSNSATPPATVTDPPTPSTSTPAATSSNSPTPPSASPSPDPTTASAPPSQSPAPSPTATSAASSPTASPTSTGS